MSSLKWVGWGWTLIWVWLRRGGVGAYSRWALIRGWALIRINTVDPKATFEPAQAYYGFLLFFSSLRIRSLQLTHRRENRDITKLRRRRQRECLKHKRFRKHNNNSLSTCITLFCKFLCRSYTPKTWNDQILSFVEDDDGKTILKFYHLCLNSEVVPFL